MPKTLNCDPALFDKDLSGRVYIVTGANSGSGLATTEQLVRQGAQVVAACRRVASTMFVGISQLRHSQWMKKLRIIQCLLDVQKKVNRLCFS